MATDLNETIEFSLRSSEKSRLLKWWVFSGLLYLPFIAFSLFHPKPDPPDAADRFVWWITYSQPFISLGVIGFLAFFNWPLRSRKSYFVLRIEDDRFLIENQYLGILGETSEEVTVAQKDGIKYHIHSKNHGVSFSIKTAPANFKKRMEYFLTES